MDTYPDGDGGAVAGSSIRSRIYDYATRLRAAIYGNNCVSADWNYTADEKISVAIFYTEGLHEEAEIVRDYAEYAIAEAFGDDFRVYVTVESAVPEDIKEINDFRRHVKSEYGVVADTHHLVADAGQHIGVNGWSMTSKHDVLPAKTDCLQRKNAGRSYEDVNYSIHEIGHGLGMSHRDSSSKTEDLYIPPMATGYVKGARFIHEYHEDSIDEAEVVWNKK